MSEPTNSNGNGKITWYQLLTPLIGLLVTVLLLISNQTLQGISSDIKEIHKGMVDHETRIARVETTVGESGRRLDGLEDRERQAWAFLRRGSARVSTGGSSTSSPGPSVSGALETQ